MRPLSATEAGTPMRTYCVVKRSNSRRCALGNARLSTSKQVARELWKMAQEYQAEAAKLGKVPDLGNPPEGLED